MVAVVAASVFSPALGPPPFELVLGLALVSFVSGFATELEIARRAS
jgi:hypothetical protein